MVIVSLQAALDNQRVWSSYSRISLDLIPPWFWLPAASIFSILSVPKRWMLRKVFVGPMIFSYYIHLIFLVFFMGDFISSLN